MKRYPVEGHLLVGKYWLQAQTWTSAELKTQRFWVRIPSSQLAQPIIFCRSAHNSRCCQSDTFRVCRKNLNRKVRTKLVGQKDVSYFAAQRSCERIRGVGHPSYFFGAGICQIIIYNYLFSLTEPAPFAFSLVYNYSHMLILGIDPGTATTGFGIVSYDGSGNKVVEWGLIETDKNVMKERRLDHIFESTLELLKKHKPDVFVIEKVFFSNNAKTVIAVGQAQGVMLLAASKAKVQVMEYAPGTIKKMITGSGRANKKEVQEHIRKILGNKVKSQARKKTHFDNAADALAIALTHAFKIGEAKLTDV